MSIEQLNEQQRKAAQAIDGPVMVLAGAGSGKTKTLTERAAYLIEQGVWPSHILCITFTNKAAAEMRQRIDASVGEDARRMWIHTFHGMCARILRKEGSHLGYTKDFTIYDSTDAQRLMKRCLQELDMDEKYYPPRAVLDAVSRAKNHYADAGDYFAQSSDVYRKRIYEVYLLYERLQRENNAMDFDNLLLKTIALFEKFPEVKAQYAMRFEYIMVDEYQDTNQAQYRLIRHLASAHKNLCVVGDDDQSIYGWRGADIRNILNFEKDFPGAQVIRLEQNYRSYSRILDAANAVISHNIARKGKTLFTERGKGNPVVVYRAATERGEADYIVSQMARQRERYRYSDMAVLYRTNAQSRAIEDALMRAGIPYRVYGGMKFYDRREVRDVVALLRFLQNPRDDLSYLTIVNVPKRGVGEAAVLALREAAAQYSVSASDIAREAVSHLGNKRSAKSLEQMMAWADELIAKLSTTDPYEFIVEAVDRSGMLQQYQQDRSDEAQSRAENIAEFVGSAKEYFETNQGATLSDFLQGISLVMDTDTYDENQSSVTLMTLHSAKGLEFPVVFLAGMEEGIFPHSRSLEDEAELEEERRLCYVGITRAMDHLTLTYCAARNLYNRILHQIPSRFLDELPEKGVERQGIGAAFSTNSSTAYWNDAPKERIQKNALPRRPMARPNVNGAQQVAYAIGDRVRHPMFKEGTVVKIEDTVLDIAFPGVGIKKIDTKYAVLKKV